MKGEKDTTPPAPKPRFKPKIPVRKQKAAVKVEPSETKGDLIDKELLAKLNSAKAEDSFERRPKAERKAAPVEVAFGQGRSSTIRTFGKPKSAVIGSNHEDGFAIPFPKVKEYVEPWDYENTYYPITLPLRQPYSGNPEILDKKEFGEDAKKENKKNATAAEELGLMDASMKPEMFFFQFPEILPFIKLPQSGESKPENAKSDNKGKGNRMEACGLKDLPSGRLGKMIVYKSGKIKMKMGDTLFDVSAGQDCVFAQDAAVISVKDKRCCVISEITKRAIVTPDVDSLLDPVNKM